MAASIDRLAGRIACVTGGGRGTGRAISGHLAGAAATVAVGYRSDAHAAAETVAAIESADGVARAHAASVDDSDAMAAMVAAIDDELGIVYVVVCTAGVASWGDAVADIDPDELIRVLHTHAVGAHHSCRRVVPGMRSAERGDIVMISSVFATLAKVERVNGVHVNIVAPVLVETDMGVGSLAPPPPTATWTISASSTRRPRSAVPAGPPMSPTWSCPLQRRGELLLRTR